jgi:novobiocin biosynthesis protein NovU/D-mycarose 3-C-methyltransferase
MYTAHTQCRACGFGSEQAPSGIKSATQSEKLIPVLDLGIQPLANDFRAVGEECAGFAPLQVLFCPRCTLAQLSVVVDPAILYRNYSYVTSPSATMANHFDRLFDDLLVMDAKGVVEIGSNDGRMLARWQQRAGALRVMGIDPAKNLAEIANSQNIPTVNGLFNEETAGVAQSVNPDIVIARHCFCHINDWRAFIDNLARLGHQDTAYCIEVPYVVDLLGRAEFDTIYHEHLSYLSLTAMDQLLRFSPLYLSRVHKYPIHGGAILITLRRRLSPKYPHIAPFEFKEDITVRSWRMFSVDTNDRISAMHDLMERLYFKAKSVCGFGASAKSTVLINACHLNRNHISFICDSTPQKQYKLSPGTDIPIVDEGALLRELPNFCVVFAWNFFDEIVSKNKAYTDAGGRFINPMDCSALQID